MVDFNEITKNESFGSLQSILETDDDENVHLVMVEEKDLTEDWGG